MVTAAPGQGIWLGSKGPLPSAEQKHWVGWERGDTCNPTTEEYLEPTFHSILSHMPDCPFFCLYKKKGLISSIRGSLPGEGSGLSRKEEVSCFFGGVIQGKYLGVD